MSAQNTESLGLYIHFPWCVKKCPYCDFNSHRAGSVIDQPQYIRSLLEDLDLECSAFNLEREVTSVFLGGGTPSLFSAESMDQLLQGVAKRLPLKKDVEITMEANPGTTEHADFSAYRQTGINRLSIGVQSFNDSQLSTLGRVHSSDEAAEAYKTARQGGFDNINLDLMFALPGQTVDDALNDIESAIELAPDHLSVYQLTLEPDTVFYRYPPKLPADDDAYEIEVSLQQRLESAGYHRYEISAYSKPHKRCQHNTNYWQFGDYIGIGAGAHGKMTYQNEVIRRSRKKHPATYISAAGKPESLAESKTIPTQDILFEYMMNALRLSDGVPMSDIMRHTGMTELAITGILQGAIDSGLVSTDGGNVRCSRNGYLFLDSILTGLLNE